MAGCGGKEVHGYVETLGETVLTNLLSKTEHLANNYH